MPRCCRICIFSKERKDDVWFATATVNALDRQGFTVKCSVFLFYDSGTFAAHISRMRTSTSRTGCQPGFQFPKGRRGQGKKETTPGCDCLLSPGLDSSEALYCTDLYCTYSTVNPPWHFIRACAFHMERTVWHRTGQQRVGFEFGRPVQLENIETAGTWLVTYCWKDVYMDKHSNAFHCLHVIVM